MKPKTLRGAYDELQTQYDECVIRSDTEHALIASGLGSAIELLQPLVKEMPEAKICASGTAADDLSLKCWVGGNNELCLYRPTLKAAQYRALADALEEENGT